MYGGVKYSIMNHQCVIFLSPDLSFSVKGLFEGLDCKMVQTFVIDT